jgi:flagellar FliJ protein
MRKSQRIEVYRQSLSEARDQRAARAHEIDQRLMMARRRLQELRAYRDEYANGFSQSMARGLGTAALVDYQSFLLRLDAAIGSQQELIRRTEQEHEYSIHQLREVAVQHEAVRAVIDRWDQQELRAQQRYDQRITDERAQQVRSHELFQEAS